MDLEARTAALPRFLIRQGSKVGINPNLKKFGSATTKPRVETSIVWTTTLRLLNSLDMAASRLEYLFNLYSLDRCMLVSRQIVNSPTTILKGDTIAMSGLGPLKRSQTCLVPGTPRSQNRVWLDFICGTIHFTIISKIILCRLVY